MREWAVNTLDKLRHRKHATGAAFPEDFQMAGTRYLGLAVVLFATTLHGQEVITTGPAGPTLSGVVKDLAGVPVGDVEVGVFRGERLQQFVTTEADGTFLLSGFSPGVVPLRFRRLGYAIQFMDVDTRTPAATSLQITLKAVASQLDEVTIAANDRRLNEFYNRKEQRGSFARFLDHSEILRLGPRNSSDLFRTMPGVVISSSTGGNIMRIRGCQPMVWVDGQRVPGAELDEVIRPNEIAGIEFYPSNAGIPAQFTERGNRLCGSVLVWTRTQ
jgi:Carboxypeptidase regulatory-like domain/TonB-dependent Receptor Plug Domain